MCDYSVIKKDDGTYEFTDLEGKSFVEDPSSEKFSDFLHWLSLQGPSHRLDFDGQPAPDCFYFGEMQQLVEHLKQSQEFLYVSRGAADVIGTVDTMESNTLGHTTYFMLPVSGVPGEDPEFIQFTMDHQERSGLRRSPSSIYATLDLVEEINDRLRKEPNHDIRRLSSYPIERTFVYLDVSDFSKAKAGEQALIIRAIIALVRDDKLWGGDILPPPGINKPEAMLCIGDGYIFVFESPVYATCFAAYLAQLIESSIARKKIIEFHFRMGVHVGKVYCFWDPGRGGWNYVGAGINGGNRVISAIGKDADDIVFISAQVRRALVGKPDRFSPQIINHCQNRGRRADKHGNSWRVYELNHSGFTAREMPGAFRNYRY